MSTLEPGTRLGSYEVVAPIGAGGMGEVYRARDSKLGREVAIKVLPEAFTEHPEKLARFEREARLLASLTHPRIATLHGLEEAEGKPFLVMELIEGETLAERIARGPLPVNEALTLAQHIAEALEAAHEKGVIHRDLKPANIKVDSEGHAKVLDFGLAKALVEEVPEGDLSASPTLSREETRDGVILGTAAYMSPEQARGKVVDKRTDIFSFGMVLYEMLTGRKAFAGEDVSDVLASIMKLEPDWKALPSGLDPRVEYLLRRCLRKDRKKRLRDIGDAGSEIEEVLASPATPAATDAARIRVLGIWQAIAGLLAVAFGIALWNPWGFETPSESPVRLSVKLGAGDRPLAAYANAHGSMAVLSPDGKTLAFVGRAPDGNSSQIYLRPLDSLQATPISGTEGAFSPFFSPGGEWLAFFTPGALKKVSVSGGAALTIAEVPNGRGGTWGADDTIVYTPTTASGLYRVPASGGTPVELTQLGEGEASHRWPWFLPNGEALLFMVRPAGRPFDEGIIEAVLLDSGERKVLHRGGTYPHYLTSGHLLYTHEATLFALSFDLDRIEPTGEPGPVLEDVLTYSGNGASQYGVSGDGSLAYVPGEVFTPGDVPGELVRVDRDGNGSPLTETRGSWETPRFSPDGQRLAVRRMTGAGTGAGIQDVWMLELSRGTLTRLTFEQGIRPLWSPDGDTIFFASVRTGSYNIFSKPADGSGPAEQLTTGPFRVPASMTSDGRTLIFRQGGDTGSPDLDIGMMRLEAEAEPEMLLETSFGEHTPKLSPDDRWLAYVSDESGRDEIYVTRFPSGGKWQISTEGGKEPMWSRDGRELFYRNGEKMMAVAVPAGPESAGKPTLLFEGPYELKAGSGASNYDVTPDGQGFVMIRTPESPAESSATTQVTFVFNWFEELKRLVPVD